MQFNPESGVGKKLHVVIPPGTNVIQQLSIGTNYFTTSTVNGSRSNTLTLSNDSVIKAFNIGRTEGGISIASCQLPCDDPIRM